MSPPLPLPRGILRVYAMARPARPPQERALVARACDELALEGSRRQRGKALAVAVATVALAYVRKGAGDDIGAALGLAGAVIRTPSLFALATDPAIDTAAIAADECHRQFTARGLRLDADPEERPQLESQLVAATAARLADRYRRMLK